MAPSSKQLVALLMITLVTTAPFTADASCALVDDTAAKCGPYMTHATDTISKDCCTALGKSVDALHTKAEKVEACECLKKAILKVKGFDYGRADAVHDKCNKVYPFPIDKGYDCSKA
ncbi:Non-specific lipid-transfer protein 3-like protein [Drosera capensis]